MRPSPGGGLEGTLMTGGAERKLRREGKNKADQRSPKKQPKTKA